MFFEIVQSQTLTSHRVPKKAIVRHSDVLDTMYFFPSKNEEKI